MAIFATALFFMMRFVRYFLQLAVFLSLPAGLFAEPDLVPVGPEGGDVRTLALHPQVPDRVFLGTADGQVFVSENYGSDWTKITPGLGIRQVVIDSLVFDETDPNTLYAGGWALKSDHGWLFRTRDAGKTWERLDLGRHQSSIRAVAVAPSNRDVIAAGITEGVVLSTDGGRTWNRISRGYRSLYDVHSLTFDPVDSNVLFVGTWRLPWKTVNLGKSWQALHQGMFWDSDVFSIRIDPRDRQTVFASACSGIYKSTSGGEQWSRLRNGLPPEAKRTRILRFDPSNPDIVYAGTTAGLYLSANSGASWKKLLGDVIINAIVVHPAAPERILLGTEDAGVLESRNGGKSFSPANRGFSQRQIASVAFGGQRKKAMYAAIPLDRQFGGFFVSHDNGEMWSAFNEGLQGALTSIGRILPATRSDMVFLASSNGVFRGEPLQSGWHLVPATAGLNVNQLDFCDPSEQCLMLASRQGIHRLDLKTGKLRKLKIGVYNREVSAVAVDQSTGEAFIGTDMGVFRSTDDGQSWVIKVKGLPYTAVLSLRKAGKRLFCGTRDGLFLSDDSGEAWRQAKEVLPLEISVVEADPEHPETVYAADATVGYFFTSRDGGDSWESFNLSGAVSRISSMAVGPEGEIIAGTVSESVVRIIPPGARSAREVSVLR